MGMRGHRPYAFALGALLLATGLAWLWLEHFVRIEGPFGSAHHPAQAWVLILHGVAGMLAVWGFGALWTYHVRGGWRRGRQRASGGLLFVTLTVLSLTGLLLYYAGSDRLREWASLAHWLVGLGATVALLLHGLRYAVSTAARGAGHEPGTGRGGG